MPIRWRLTIFNALVIGGILLALGCALFFLLRQTLRYSVEDTARKGANVAATEIDRGEGLDEEDGRLELDGGLAVASPMTMSSSSCGMAGATLSPIP